MLQYEVDLKMRSYFDGVIPEIPLGLLIFGEKNMEVLDFSETCQSY